MTNQSLPGSLTSRRFAKCPATVKANDDVLIGVMPAVALDSYSTLTGGTTFEMSGSYVLSVLAATVISPLTGHQIGFGDKIYADGGTLDATTNVTTGFTLDAATGGVLFGYYDPQQNAAVILSAATNATASVKLAGSE